MPAGSTEGLVLVPPAPTDATVAEVLAQLERSMALVPAKLHVFDLRSGQSVLANVSLAAALGHAEAHEDRALLHPDDQDRLADMLRRWTDAEDAAVLQTTYRARHADGHWHRLLSQDRLLARTEAGDPALVVGTVLDITPLDARYQHEASMERLEALGRLAGGVAHDFNNHLTGILGCATVLVDDPPPEELRRLAAEVLRSSERAVELARLLLGFGRTRSDRAVEGRSDARPSVRDTELILRRLLPEGVQVHAELQEGAFGVELGPGQVGRLTAYLLLDAADAVEASGRIRLGLEGVELAAPERGLRAGRWVKIVVEDDGGARSLDLEVAPYQPKDGAFGLAAVREMVEPRGGRLFADRTESGVQVQVWLPRHDLAEGPVPEVVGRTALVVDDEPSVQRLLAKVLRRAGYDVFPVGEGAAALELAQHLDRPFDLAICDFALPDHTGLEVLHRLGEMARAKVLTTGRQPTADLDRQLEAAGLRLLVKPFSPSDLLQFLDDAVS